jgi:hypothetical protein
MQDGLPFSTNILSLTGQHSLTIVLLTIDNFFYQHSVADGTIEAKEEKKKNVLFHFAGF